MAIQLPNVCTVESIHQPNNCLYISAYGFEDRSLGWVKRQANAKCKLKSALIFKYKPSKGKNRVQELKDGLKVLGDPKIIEIPHNVNSPHDLEVRLKTSVTDLLSRCDEVVVDISAMTKLIIMVTLAKLAEFQGKVRIVYSEAEEYPPTEEQFKKASNGKISTIARFPSPSRGSECIIRTRSLSSIRMQGQPMTLIAFMSFNEQLIRHMLGTVSPHRLVFINGCSPRSEFQWREYATQKIHEGLLNEFSADNPSDEKTHLINRVTSTMDYRETTEEIDRIFKEVGNFERIICAATGSKMQTVGLLLAKMMHPEIHIEYPTPDSYYFKGAPQGVREVHEIIIPDYCGFIAGLRKRKS